MDDATVLSPAARIDRLLRSEPVVWMSTVRPDGTPHLIPIWFSWDGEAILVASKPAAQKVRNLRTNPVVMLALGQPDADFDVGLLEGRAELVDAPAADLLPASHLAKYRAPMASIGLTPEEFLATYTQVIRIVPTRYLPWHGRTEPASARPEPPTIDQRLAAAIRRVAATVASSGTTSPPGTVLAPGSPS
ncbi:MAG TPA: pyridoxamine 5'-phosphate oxidase family protein [Candidatus Limnocylindrales bacterium]|nr:pyridoxamine 5'-phosphate oxidase family protein [Candidatus Limnocylindrales bacterium]